MSNAVTDCWSMNICSILERGPCPAAPYVHGGNARTIEVSRHGCIIHALRPYLCGSELQLDALYEHRTTIARVSYTQIRLEGKSTLSPIALELSKPGNFW